MANDYRILDERDIKNFQAGNKLEVTEIGNKVTYEHIGEPPNMLPSQEKVLEYGNSFNITIPSVYDSTGHVKSETKYSFIMPQETDTSNFLTTDNFLSESPIHIEKNGKNITYSHDEVSMTTIIPESATQLTYGGTFEIPALSAADGYGHATEQKTYKFQMPQAPEPSDIPEVDKVTLTNDVTGTGTFSNGTCSISTTLKNLSDSSKNYGWNGATVNENIGINNEKETFNPELKWGSTIKVPNFLVDEKGRVQSGWTSKYKLPAAPTIPKVDKVKLDGAVTGEASFNNGICSISTTLQSKPVNTINITGAVTGTGTESSGNWTVNTQLAYNQWILESQIFTTGDSPENFIINQDISKNILISCFFVIGHVNRIENGINTYGISDNFNIIIPVQRLTSLKTLEYNIKLPLIKVSNNGTKIDLIGNSSTLITFSYNTTSKKMTIQFPGYVSGHFKVQGLL